jgi:hypothetical protein
LSEALKWFVRTPTDCEVGCTKDESSSNGKDGEEEQERERERETAMVWAHGRRKSGEINSALEQNAHWLPSLRVASLGRPRRRKGVDLVAETYPPRHWRTRKAGSQETSKRLS